MTDYINRRAQTAITDALAIEATADDWTWAPAPEGYIRRDISAPEAIALVRGVRPTPLDPRQDEHDPPLADIGPGGAINITRGAGVIAYLLRLRLRRIPIWVRM